MTQRGRSGRTRLGKSLATARHGALLLDRKDRILGDELERLHLLEERARSEWERRACEANVWLIRAAALDGRTRIAAARPSVRALLSISWGGSVGVSYPDEVNCDPPVAPPPGGSSALSFALSAHREAVAAGVRYAGVRRAISLVHTELIATRIRRRAIENRWIPRLTTQLATITRELDAQELEDMLRIRWASTASSPTASSTAPPLRPPEVHS